MDKMPLVSISIPAYNHERYVQECIQSIIDQDYPRIELIVIDDGSKDKTWEKIQEMRPACEKRFERVILERQENKGCSATCRRADSLKHGEIVGGIASDDKYLPGAVSKLVTPIFDGKYGFSVGRNIMIDENSQRYYLDKNKNKVFDIEQAKYLTRDDVLMEMSGVDFCSEDFGLYKTFTKGNYIPNGSFRLRTLKSNTPLYDPKAPLEDWWLHLQLSKVTKYKYVKEDTFCYRNHETNTCKNKDKMIRMYDETQFRERECLIANNDVPWLEIFAKDFYHEKRIFGVKIGSHYPSIKEIYNFNTRQFRIVCSNYSFPISPKRPW